VVKIALTEAQAREVYPGRAVFDGIQVDAMPTPQLRGILRDALTSRMDGETRGDVLQREEAGREENLAALNRGPAVSLWIGPRWARLRLSKRGVQAGIGPRWLRSHTGGGGDGISTGAGPVTLYHGLRRRRRR
jgi:hypothetical protein